MPHDVPSPPAPPGPADPDEADTLLRVEAAGQALEAGAPAEAIARLEPCTGRRLSAGLRAQVMSRLALASFRIGEYDDAVRHCDELLGAVDAGVQLALPWRFNVRAVAAVACALTDRFEAAMALALAVQTLAKRLEPHDYRPRAHATAATVIILIGDPWAGARMLDALAHAARAGDGGDGSARELEATVHRNRAACALMLARLARDAGETAARDAALGQAEAALAEEAAALQAGNARDAGFVVEHRAELALLRGDARGCAAALEAALQPGGPPPIPGRCRALQLLRLEAMLHAGDSAAALELAEALAPALRPGHEVGYRLRLAALHADALAAQGRHAEAAAARLAHQRAFAAHAFAQAAALSRAARQKLELEHVWTASNAGFAPPAAPRA